MRVTKLDHFSAEQNYFFIDKCKLLSLFWWIDATATIFIKIRPLKILHFEIAVGKV